MKKSSFLMILVSIITLLTSCNSSDNGTKSKFQKDNDTVIANTDSIELTSLVRKVYEWHMTKYIIDFPYKYEAPADTIFIGIDWDAYNKNIEIFKKTDYFTDDFLSFHKTIASDIDSSMKKADIEWRNINDGIPLWDTDADDWCGCQDYPDKYWVLLTLDSLRIENNFASFNWTWDTKPSVYPHNYKMTAKKIGKKWKVNAMDGFRYYGNVEYYDKIMQE